MAGLIDIPGNEQHIGGVAMAVVEKARQAKEAKMGNAVVARDNQAPAPAMSESTAIIQMIERAALNPQVDIDKMERLLQMQERIMARNAKAAYDAAFADMQKELPVITERGGIKDRNGNVQSKYALWEDINEAIKPVLARHGFGISFRTGKQDGQIVVTGVLSHREGHREETEMELPTDTSGSKNAVQAVGSSTSYGKRYTASALLNLTSRGEDDDGKAAAGPETISKDQIKTILSLITETGSDIEQFCRMGNIESVPEMAASQFEGAVRLLNQKKAKMSQRVAS